MTKLSKNAQVLKFLVQQCRPINTTRLQKLAYLADLEARKWLGHPITQFEYVWHNHGPFDKSIYSGIEELIGAGVATQDDVTHANGHTERRLHDQGIAVAFDFTPAEAEILQYIVREYGRTPLNELVDDIVYETAPVKVVQRRGERLPMEMLDNVERNRCGFDMEALIEAEKEIELGHYVLASDFFNELRSKISSAS